jgi:hypothetical protein
MSQLKYAPGLGFNVPNYGDLDFLVPLPNTVSYVSKVRVIVERPFMLDLPGDSGGQRIQVHFVSVPLAKVSGLPMRLGRWFALVESLPLWPLMETTVTPLTTFEGRIQAVQSKLKQLKSLVQDPAGVIEGVT